MSLNVALNTAVSGLFANQRALAATSENIANVNTEGFSRREATFITDAIPDQFSGVNVEIARAGVNRFLQTASFDANASAGAADIQSDALARIEASLGAPGENVSFANKLNDAFASLANLASTPTSTVAKATALSDLSAAFDAFSRTQDAINAEISAGQSQLDASVARANVLLKEIFDLNQIAPESDGAADILTARLNELSSLISINVAFSDDGRVEVATSSGVVLANSAEFGALAVAAGPPVSLSLSSVSQQGAVTTTAVDDFASQVTGGALRGLIDLINIDAPALANTVESAARAVADALNAVYDGNASFGSTGPGASPLITEVNGRLSVNAALTADPSQFAIARPGAGAGGANDGRGAAALAAIGSDPSNNQVTEAVAAIGAAARNAALSAQTQEAFANELSARTASEGGVNLDEELSNLILYQRAYGANARVIAAVDQLWESLLSII